MHMRNESLHSYQELRLEVHEAKQIHARRAERKADPELIQPITSNDEKIVVIKCARWCYTPKKSEKITAREAQVNNKVTFKRGKNVTGLQSTTFYRVVFRKITSANLAKWQHQQPQE